MPHTGSRADRPRARRQRIVSAASRPRATNPSVAPAGAFIGRKNARAATIAALAASHLFSFIWNYLYRGEFRRAALTELMQQPYGRVVVLHLTILLGGFAAMLLGSPLWALLLLIGLKIALDLKAHLKEHRPLPA